MTFEELKAINYVVATRVTSVEDINGMICLSKNSLRDNFQFWIHLAAHHGGIYDKKRRRFRSHFEYDPVEKTLKPATIKTDSFISDKSIVRRKGMIYLSGWWRSTVEKEVKLRV